MNKNNDMEEFDMEFEENATLHRIYTFAPYTHWRIKQILNDYYNAHLVCIRGYKEGRYPGYKQHYNVYDNTTGHLIREHIYLDDLRRLFARQDFPLQEPTARNPGAERFLQSVKNSQNTDK